MKNYLSSVIAMSIMGGMLTATAYELGKFNAQVANELVSGFAMQAQSTPAVQARIIFGAPKTNKKRKVMIARR
jgi:hypothetical protein